jgi:predicted translin family RNA/ssDNA-binding protein
MKLYLSFLYALMIRMSAEEEALSITRQIHKTITETLEDLRQGRNDSRKLSEEEKKTFNLIVKQVNDLRKALDNYIKQFRVQTRLDDF